MDYIETYRKQDISISSSGDNIVITPGSGEMPAGWDNSGTYIAIDSINLVVNGNTTLQFKNGKSSGEGGQSNYGGQYTLVQSGALVLENVSRNEHGIITLNPNKSFVINLGSGVQVSGFIRYRLVGTN